MMINNKKSYQISIYRYSYIVTAIFIAILFAICSGVFYSVTYEASVIVLNFTRVIAYIAAGTNAVLICFRCAKINKLKNPDGFIPPRDMFYYLKRMGFMTLMMILMNIALSVGVFWEASFFGKMFEQIDDLFIRELTMKLPFFIIYLVYIYNIFQKYGFMDSQKKIYNINFKMLTVIITFITMIPGIVYDNFISIRDIEKCSLSIQAVFSPHNGIYTVMENGKPVLNENFTVFNLLLIIVTILFTFALQAGTAWFAYRRGKHRFIKDYLSRPDEYETDENI